MAESKAALGCAWPESHVLTQGPRGNETSVPWSRCPSHPWHMAPDSQDTDTPAGRQWVPEENGEMR